MKKVLGFDKASAPSLAAGLRSGLRAYAVNVPKAGPPATLWLQVCDGRTFRIGVEMHDLEGWEEIGTPTFEVVGPEGLPKMVKLSGSWADVKDLRKLAYISDVCEAECGFAISSGSGEQLIVVPGADVRTLAISAPFYALPFTPENDLAAYALKGF